ITKGRKTKAVVSKQPERFKPTLETSDLVAEMQDFIATGDFANKSEFLKALKAAGHDEKTISRAAFLFPKIIRSEKQGTIQEHLDYFGDRQLSEKSEIREIRKQIQQTQGKRLANVIPVAKANARIHELRRRLVRAADREGVSVRITKGGKIVISVRKSGAFVPERFSRYDNFKDVKANFGGTKDITRYIQEIDGSLTVAEKEFKKGQAGPVERNILWPTRDISIQKLKW
ncbi:unnamed protein product, partial [marine sediment metagenome]